VLRVLAGGGERAGYERRADAALLEGRVNGERPEHQGVRRAGMNRGEPHRTNKKRPDERREGKIENMRRALAQALGGAGEAAGAEGALVQALDRLSVGGQLGADDEGKLGHGRA
jgi:hypothetical protein